MAIRRLIERVRYCDCGECTGDTGVVGDSRISALRDEVSGGISDTKDRNRVGIKER